MPITFSIILGLLLMSYATYQFTNKEKYVRETLFSISCGGGLPQFAERLFGRAVLFLLGEVLFLIPFALAVRKNANIANILALILAVSYSVYVGTYSVAKTIIPMVKYLKKKV